MVGAVGRRVFQALPVTGFLKGILRAELRAARVSVDNRINPAKRRALRELKGQRDLLVNVACGPHPLDGFVNLDLYATGRGTVAWDCRHTLPFTTASIRGIRAEHFFEHLEAFEEVPAFLNEARRVLKPGGVLRIIVPDARRFLEAYLEDGRAAFDALAVPNPFPDDHPTRMDVVNHVFHQRHEHRWGYDLETLRDRLLRAGFADVQQTAFGRSLDPALAHDQPHHAPYSLYVDAW